MQIRCRCGQQMAVTPEEAGSTIRCPACNILLKVPAPAAKPVGSTAPISSALATSAPDRTAPRKAATATPDAQSLAPQTQPAARPKLSAAARDHRLLWLVLAGLIGMALLMVYFFARTAIDYRAAQRWVETPAKILSAQLEDSVRTSYRKGRRR